MRQYLNAMTHGARLITVAVLCIALTACASIDTRLKAAADIHTATTKSVTRALNAELISVKDAEAYQDIAVNASHVLDSAYELKDVDLNSAEAQLDLANHILVKLHAYLLKKEKEQQR